MRTLQQVNEGITFFYQKKSEATVKIYAVQDNYCKTLERVEQTLEYCKELGIEVPAKSEITINKLAGPRYKGMMCIEFESKTIPPTGHELTPDSALWDWLQD